ncbi:hypothetical protein AAFG13_17505 [Bradyrhizobium sp. B124]|uniref:hypothetical protein n=1 Tax=Bradyrhizobium sp. B124 TaxID=3140245 RepID=UPI00318466AB
MTPKECRDRAEHCRQAKATIEDDFTRRYLAALEQSYRVLANTQEAVRQALKDWSDHNDQTKQ